MPGKNHVARQECANRTEALCNGFLDIDVITEDVAVPRENIAPLIKKIAQICKENDITVCIMGHAGDGNIHPNFALDLSDKSEVIRFKKVKDELFNTAIKLKGTLSGEHGIGSEKKEYLEKALDKKAYEYMKKIKELFDPENMFNPNLMF